MDKRSVEDFLKTYGDTEVKFHSYNKFVFLFEANISTRKRVVVSIGGNHEDIYNCCIENKPIKIKDIGFKDAWVYKDDCLAYVCENED